MIVVLDKITLREAEAIADAATDRNTWNAEVPGLIKPSLDAILGEDGFIQQRGAEAVCPIDLKSALPGVVCGGKLRNRCGPTVAEQSAEEAAVYAVVLQVFVNADEVLSAVAEIGRVETSRIDHRSGTRQIVCRSRSTCAGEDIVGRFQDGCADDMRRHVSRQNLSTKGVWIIGFGPRRKCGIGECLRHAACRGGRTQRFHSEKEEELMMGYDWSANSRRDVVAVKRSIRRSMRKFRVCKHLLVIEIVTR